MTPGFSVLFQSDTPLELKYMILQSTPTPSSWYPTTTIFPLLSISTPLATSTNPGFSLRFHTGMKKRSYVELTTKKGRAMVLLTLLSGFEEESLYLTAAVGTPHTAPVIPIHVTVALTVNVLFCITSIGAAGRLNETLRMLGFEK